MYPFVAPYTAPLRLLMVGWSFFCDRFRYRKIFGSLMASRFSRYFLLVCTLTFLFVYFNYSLLNRLRHYRLFMVMFLHNNEIKMKGEKKLTREKFLRLKNIIELNDRKKAGEKQRARERENTNRRTTGTNKRIRINKTMKSCTGGFRYAW